MHWAQQVVQFVVHLSHPKMAYTLDQTKLTKFFAQTGHHILNRSLPSNNPYRFLHRGLYFDLKYINVNTTGDCHKESLRLFGIFWRLKLDLFGLFRLQVLPEVRCDFKKIILHCFKRH